MVATRVLPQNQKQEKENELRQCLRDIVALSNLPTIWLRADPEQVAKSLAELVVSILDVDFACVAIDDLRINVLQSHNHAGNAEFIRCAFRPEWRSPNKLFEHEGLRGFSVQVGRAVASSLTAFCRRPDFPTELEQLILRISSSQAAVTIQRWQDEQSLRAQITRREELERQQTDLLEEQSALYRFTDALYRAECTQDVYEAALASIIDALRCSRASILLFDNQGVMRFAAWRNLSSDYRAAVEGHSPWDRNAVDPAPLCIDSVSDSDFAEALKRTVLSEGIAALSFVPLVANGRLIGKFMTYYDAPHRFTPRELDVAVTIARQLGFAIEQDRLRLVGLEAERALRESEVRKTAILESAVDGIVALDEEGRIIDFNPSAERLFGYPRSSVIGRSVLDIMTPDRFHEAEPTGLMSFLQLGDVGNGQHLEFSALRADGTKIETEVTIAAATSRDVDVRFIACIRDITERKRAEAHRELLIAELNHRVKNTLANVIAIGHQSFSKSRSPEEAWRSFDERIRALAQTHSRLAEAQWSSVSLEALVMDELQPYRANETQVRVTGPYLGLGPKRAISLGMAMHELATNAAKHGALSTRTGSLAVSWQINDGKVRLTWTESGGPLVQPPRRSGFGTFLLERALALDLNGRVDLTFAPAGVRCSIVFPFNDEVTQPTAVKIAGPEAAGRRPPNVNGSTKPEPAIKPQILVVEDEFFLAIEVQDTLTSQGFSVVGPCHNLNDASGILKRQSVDLALLDTNLDGQMVYPLADELVSRSIPCIFVTGYGATNLPERFRNLPRIAKPYQPSVLVAEICSVLNSRKSTLLAEEEKTPSKVPDVAGNASILRAEQKETRMGPQNDR